MRIDQVADGAVAVTGSSAGWLLVRDGSDLTLVDSGYPADIGRLETSIRKIGHRIEDVRAVLLTHAHVDHLGGAVHLHERAGTPLLMHPLEVPNALGHQRQQATAVDVAVRSWRPRVARWGLHVAALGGARHVTAPRVRPFPRVGPLDLPGAPVPVHTGGHTSGHCAYLFPGSGVLATGDALVTGHPLSTITGPQLLPDFFAHDAQVAAEGLDLLAPLAADVLVPGHGPPWRGSPVEAVAQARDSAGRRLR